MPSRDSCSQPVRLASSTAIVLFPEAGIPLTSTTRRPASCPSDRALDDPRPSSANSARVPALDAALLSAILHLPCLCALSWFARVVIAPDNRLNFIKPGNRQRLQFIFGGRTV